MKTILPFGLAVDAVAEKRTADEDDDPPTVEEAQAYVRRIQSLAMEQAQGKLDGEQWYSKDPSCSSATEERTPPSFNQEEDKKTKFARSSSEGTKKSKPRSKKSATTLPINVTKVSHCNGVHFGSNYTMQSFHINGVTTSFKNPQEAAESTPTVPKEILRCNALITDDDCQVVCQYVICSWEILGEQLFFKQFDEIKRYLNGIDEKKNDEAVRLILVKWRQFSGSQAKVGRLCKVFQAAKEIKAIKALAKRHGFTM